jgi:putative ABC transport system ATP-binding protein
VSGDGKGDRGLLRGEGLVLELDGRCVLGGVDVVVDAGTSLVVTGPSGAGKTVLLLVLAGLIRPTDGRVLFAGRPFGPDRSEIGLVLEHGGLVGGLTAAENVALPLQTRGLPRTEIERLVAASLGDVGLAASGERLVEELSGGQRQRVGVARAVAGSPAVVIGDEPTSELDPDSRGLVLDLLLHQHRTVVIASNDPEVAGACDQVLALGDGQVLRSAEDPGSPSIT